jgi:hypothetical protein
MLLYRETLACQHALPLPCWTPFSKALVRPEQNPETLLLISTWSNSRFTREWPIALDLDRLYHRCALLQGHLTLIQTRSELDLNVATRPAAMTSSL